MEFRLQTPGFMDFFAKQQYIHSVPHLKWGVHGTWQCKNGRLPIVFEKPSCEKAIL